MSIPINIAEKLVLDLLSRCREQGYHPTAIALPESVYSQLEDPVSQSRQFLTTLLTDSNNVDNIEFFGIPVFSQEDYELAKDILAKISTTPVEDFFCEVESEVIHVYGRATQQLEIPSKYFEM
jgi:hypothetical protein